MANGLVVEDDPIINLHLAEALENAGFETATAFGAEDALAVLQQLDEVTILLIDVRLRGGTDGLLLAREARRLHPGIRLLIASGLAKDEITDLPEGAVYLGKPFTEAQLDAAISNAMDSGSSLSS